MSAFDVGRLILLALGAASLAVGGFATWGLDGGLVCLGVDLGVVSLLLGVGQAPPPPPVG